jgi:uncharacterized protein YfbU (UPF0304 family)
MPVAMSERIELRLDEETIQSIDTWRGRQPDLPSRSEAIRHLVARGLSYRRDEPIQLSPGERLIALMLCDMNRPQQKREFDPELVTEIVGSGHLWALKQKYSWAFQQTDDPAEVDEVYAILQMWDALEESFDALTPNERQRLAKEARFSESKLRFEGFDANNENHYGIAHFIVKTLGYLDDRFGKRATLNTHMPSIDRHRRMLSVFRGIDRTVGGRRLSVDKLIEVVAARFPPNQRKDD